MGLGDFLGNLLGSKNNYQYQTGGPFGQNYDQANAGNMQLANQLKMNAMGLGPNPAQQMLKQATDKNIEQNAGMIGSQKGLSPALAQRLAAQNAARMSQTAAGEGATLGAQQQLAAQGQLGGIYQGMANNALSGMNAQNAINSGIASQNTQTGNGIVGGLLNAGGALGAAAIGGGAKPAAAHGAMVVEGQHKVAVSPGEKIVSPDGDISSVPGKAHYSGDDPRNDTVIADLRENSIVVPRTKSEDKEKMIEFISHMKAASEKKRGLDQMLREHQDIRKKLDDINYQMGKWRPNR